MQPLKSPSPRLVVVEIAFYLFISLQGFHSFLHVGNGIKDNPIRSNDAHLHSREVIHKALEYGTYVRAVTLQGNVLRWYATLEKAVAQFQSSCIVTKADGIVSFAIHTVSDLLAVGYGNVGIDASFFQVAQQSGILQRAYPYILEDGFFLFIPLWAFYNGKRTRSALGDESRPQEEILASDERSCQVEDVAPIARSKIEPNILGDINFERGCPLRAVRSGIPQGISFLFSRMNPHYAEEVRNGDFSHLSNVHQSSMIFSPTPYWVWKRSVEPPHRQRSLP